MLRSRLALAALPALAAAVLAPAALAGKAPQPPVVKEAFTQLPCPKDPQSTLELEGCAEKAILVADAQINALAKTIFGRLADDAAKKDFVAAQKAWVAFRKADCAAVSDKYEGGTLAGVLDAQCQADRSKQRVKDLKAFDKLLRAN
jgi:uncharacterized protein YecT (DUF1311 family)